MRWNCVWVGGVTGNQDVGGWYPTVAVYNTVNSSLTNYVLYPNGNNTYLPILLQWIQIVIINHPVGKKTTQYNTGV